MKVKFVGFGGYLDIPCYEDEKGKLYFDENNGRNELNLYTGAWRDKDCDEICGEPNERVTEPVECEEPFERHAREHDYGMLSRYKSDCEYFLGAGNGYEGHLYYKEVNKHCDEMKKLHNSFADNEKPEWLTEEQIEKYRADMLLLLGKKAPEKTDGENKQPSLPTCISKEENETFLAVQLEDVYISIQESTEGYDYTIYRLDFIEIDGGVYDDPDISIWEALEHIVVDIKKSPEYKADENTEIREISYEDLIEKAETVALTTVIPKKKAR